MNPRYPAVAARAEHRCEYCGAPEVVFNFRFEVEHIIPLSRNGADVDNNLALACRACNLFKGIYIDYLDPVTGTVVRLYHPRRDLWSDHYYVDAQTALIEGRTAIGRATVDALNMNVGTQVTARRIWIELGLFP